MKSSYDLLLEKYSEIRLLGSIHGLLYWDLNTYMPSKGLEYRTEQFRYLQQRIHELWTSRELASLVAECEEDASLDEIQKRDVFLVKRGIENRTGLPVELVRSLAKQSNKTLEVWKKAKQKKQFEIVEADMEKLFDLNVKKAELQAKSKGINDPFEALIGSRDPDFSVDLLTILFDEVKAFLVPFVRKILQSSVKPDTSFLSRSVPREVQVKLVEDLARFLGYNIILGQNEGRIDEVEHPLTIGCGPTDVRVTVKYHEDSVIRAFMAGGHECGHALDHLQVNPDWIGRPVNFRIVPSFNESQSRFLENIICGSREFWTYYYPRFQELTGGVFDDVSMDDFYLAINAVKPETSRMDADEVTYCLHIIIRFEIERDLFAGKIKISDLPRVWNDKYRDYLGVEVPDDTRGIMQDLHWYSQYWGYFFGYGIGDMMAAQIAMTALTRDLPDWRQSLQAGMFTPVREWLAEKIHSKGAIYDSLGLIEDITGEQLSAKYFIEYLTQKYSDLYQI
ncbi:MAG: carboxypeptidase M32 [Candidatus Odinarchaeota archaeon]